MAKNTKSPSSNTNKVTKQLKKVKTEKNASSKARTIGSTILFFVAVGVIVIPLVLLGYIYSSTKEAAGSPTFGDRYDNSLTTKIEQEHLDKIKSVIDYKEVENVEVNLTSATLRITIDVADDTKNKRINTILNGTYDKVAEILPIETYFTNDGDTKMYDLDIHIYNFIPEGDETKGWIYKELTKNAASEKSKIDTLSKAKDKELANELLNPVKEENNEEETSNE